VTADGDGDGSGENGGGDDTGGAGEVAFSWLLDLERLDPDLFRARSPRYAGRPNLFGGQVAAQALRAAATTADPAHLPHSFHLYFLRPGRVGEPVLLEVSRVRDGRSFTTRDVVARQEGEAILTMSASFHTEEPGVADYSPPATPVPPPDPERAEALHRAGWASGYAPLDVIRLPAVDGDDPRVPHLRSWIRFHDPLGDDPVVHACAFAYLTDTQTGSAPAGASGVEAGTYMMTSLDHALHFHRPIRADEWSLVDFEPVSVGRGRGMTRGTIHALDGRLGATVQQELLMRPLTGGRRPTGPPVDPDLGA
jgi:acyl-CoA thioesterase-2